MHSINDLFKQLNTLFGDSCGYEGMAEKNIHRD